MSLLFSSCLVLIAIAAIIIKVKNRDYIGNFVNLLLFGMVSLLMLGNVEEANAPLVFGLLSIVAVNFVLAQVTMLKKPYLRALVPIVSIIAYFLIFKGDSVTFLGDEYLVSNKFLITGAVVVTLAYELAQLKLLVLNKLAGISDEKGLLNSLMLLFVGIGVFLGAFGASSFGLLAVAAALSSSSFYAKKTGEKLVPAVLGLVVMKQLLDLAGGGDVNLLAGDVLFGLFIGAFGTLLMSVLWKSEKRSGLFIGAGYFIFIGLAMAAIYLETMNSNMGGMDAFAGLLIGFALTNAIKGSALVGASILSLLLVGGSYMPQLMINEDQLAFEEELISNNKEGGDEEAAVEALDLMEMEGDYTIDAEASKISFFLGEKGETKGAFKKIYGAVVIDEFIEESTFDIELKLEDLTTFNGIRDESLMGDDYFKVDQFPTMKYEASELEEVGEYEYKIHGAFTMLGVTKDISVGLKRVQVDGKDMLIGGGEIDRTKFGMTPSATEGNVVTFEYQLVLK